MPVSTDVSGKLESDACNLLRVVENPQLVPEFSIPS